MQRPILFLTLAACISTFTLILAETPQHISHEKLIVPIRDVLTRAGIVKNKAAVKPPPPARFPDPFFSILGDEKANEFSADGNGKCLQQDLADAAMTIAKSRGDKKLMGDAILFRAIERNTPAVGQASKLCDHVPVNRELENVLQHQDPSSPGAAEHNKKVELEVAHQLSKLGLDPMLALETATFAPSKDPSQGRGNTCNEENCAFQVAGKLRPIATREEILKAAAAVGR